MKVIDLYQTAVLPQTSQIPVINAGTSHFSYTAMSLFPYDREGEALVNGPKKIVQQRQRYENYRKQKKIPLLDKISSRTDRADEKYIYHLTSMDSITSLKDLKHIYKGGIRIFQPRREENNARWEAYHSNVGWLNQRGIQAIQRLASHTAIIDCTNAHPTTIHEICDIYHKPLLIRTSTRSLYKSIYNYEDDILERIVDAWWLICVPLDQNNIGDNTIDTRMQHIRYMISKRWDKNIAFASGRNGTLSTEYIERTSHTQDITHIAEQLTKTFGKKTAEKILRNNAYHFLKKHFTATKEIN